MIHGHAVIEMMLTSGIRYTRDTLREAIHSCFGEETRFYTCSAENMSADDLIDFLANRGKFIEEGEQFTFNEQKKCNH